MELTSSEEFCRYFDRLRQRTLNVARCIPIDKLEWSYRAGKWTFGDILRHLAALERWMWAENVRGNPSRYTGCGPEIAADYGGTFQFLDTMHAESMAIFSKLTDADLRAKCATPAGAPLETWKWLRAMAEHEAHHRGQLYTYLGMLDVPTPALFGLTSEEVAERAG
ncbi:MAG: DinB family protein [Candidatus Hydrogenedentales bacterium]